MEAIPKKIRTRLEAMSLADLDVMAETCGSAADDSNNMRIRVAWISAVMAERITKTFKIK